MLALFFILLGIFALSTVTLLILIPAIGWALASAILSVIISIILAVFLAMITYAVIKMYYMKRDDK